MQLFEDLKTILVYGLNADLEFYAACMYGFLTTIFGFLCIVSANMFIYAFSALQKMDVATFATYTSKDLFTMNVAFTTLIGLLVGVGFMFFRSLDGYFKYVNEIKPIEGDLCKKKKEKKSDGVNTAMPKADITLGIAK